MLAKFKSIRRVARLWAGDGSIRNVRPVLLRLSERLDEELRSRLKHLASDAGPFEITRSLHVAIDHLADHSGSLRRRLEAEPIIDAATALPFLDEEIRLCESLLSSGRLSASTQAAAVVTGTLNLLFRAKHRVKIMGARANQAGAHAPDARCMTIPSSMLYQLHHSLFPAERMIVGAGKRTGRTISIPAVFDVTGNAGPAGVQADPDRLGRALIAMSETGTHFAWWIHSHPGTGPGMTRPSEIDLRQHADWLKDYSPDLVSAIMVKDRYVRFWGTALERGAIAVELEGAGTVPVSAAENIYRLEC